LWVGFVEAQTIGKIVDKNNYKEYETLVIPPVLRAVARGEFTLPTANLDFPYVHWNRFLTAGEKNAGKFDVNKDGDLVDKSTGKIPKYNVYGFPFPKIDPNDPDAGVKIMWNFNFQKYRYMGERYESTGSAATGMSWVSKSGEERVVGGAFYHVYYQGRPSGQEFKNPQNFLSQEFQRVTEPMSMRGTNTLTWDYWDERDITGFAYVPAIRRVRQTSGTARSDPYLGSDGWMDLTDGWGGKNRSMTWKLSGERTILAPFSQITKEVVQEAPDGTITRKIPVLKYGYNTPGWKGCQWAPMNTTHVPRKVWVVEQRPKDPYYNWGLHINYVDKETYQIWAKEIYDRAGQFRTWTWCVSHYSEAPSGNNTVGARDGNPIVDEKIPHASISYNFQQTLFIPASGLGPEFFSLSNFLQMSK
jgi:hypothetical protein